MKAIEFKSKIINTTIQIPYKIQSELKNLNNKKVRVILLVDDVEKEDQLQFQKITEQEFLAGYADSDSIYDSFVNE